MSDSVVDSRFSPSGIRNRRQQEAESAVKAETPALATTTELQADPLPKPGDHYQASGRHGNKPDLTIFFVTKDYGYEGFAYADLERVRLVPADKPGVGPTLVLRFHGSVVTEVTMAGRHLNTLYHWIGLHRLPWVWEHPKAGEFTDESTPVIKRITIEETER